MQAACRYTMEWASPGEFQPVPEEGYQKKGLCIHKTLFMYKNEFSMYSDVFVIFDA